jgi:quercetin dioxygenase-like cupin family protein
MKYIFLTINIIFLCFTAKSQYNQEIIIEPLLKTDTTTIGQKLIYPQYDNDEITILKITIPPGKATGWHKHEFPVFAYILKGELSVELENNKTMQFPENSTFAEVINTLHNGINKGKDDVVLIAFFMGGKGLKLSIHKDEIKE